MLLKRSIKYLAILAAAVALAWLVVVLAGWSLPAGFLRSALSRELNRSLAPLQVTLAGPIRLTPTLTPTVDMSRLQLSWPVEGRDRPARATLGRLSLKVSLLSLLHGYVDLERVALQDLRLPLRPARGDQEKASLHFSQVAGHLFLSPDQAALEDLVVRLEQTELRGRVRLDTGSKPPRLVLHLHATQADLDNLARMVAWEDAGSRPPSQQRQTLLGTLDATVERLMQSLQGELVLKADQVLWKGAALGRGMLHITLQKHRLSIERLEMAPPGGKILLRNAIWRAGGGLGSRLELEMRNVPYGLFTRELPAASFRSQGVLSLVMSLTSRAPRVSGLLGRADGVVRVGVWPKDLHAASFDLWAANLLFALLDSLAAKTSSRVNCALGEMVMHQGLMTSKQLVIDTSKVRVEGKAEIDFARRTIAVHLEPRAKKPAFFNLETPIEIKGTFEQASAGVSPSGLVGSVIHFATSPVFAPLRRLFGHTLPASGEDVCRDPQSWPPREAPSPAGK